MKTWVEIVEELSVLAQPYPVANILPFYFFHQNLAKKILVKSLFSWKTKGHSDYTDSTTQICSSNNIWLDFEQNWLENIPENMPKSIMFRLH